MQTCALKLANFESGASCLVNSEQRRQHSSKNKIGTSGHDSVGFSSSPTGLAFGGNSSQQKIIFTSTVEPAGIVNNNGSNIVALPTIHDDDARVSKDALINAMEFMKQQNSEDYQDSEQVHCHVSDLESQGEALVTVNNDCSENDNCGQVDFGECRPNMVKNSDLLVDCPRTMLTSDEGEDDDSDLRNDGALQ